MDPLTSLINSYLHEPYASLMNGMILGKDLYVATSFYEDLKNVGLIHIVVLSGSNISLLMAITMNILLEFVNRKIASLLTIVSIIGFILFVGPEPPIIRAGIMGILSLVALLYGRQNLALYALFLSGIVMVIINNEWLTSISFQLSFAATLGIILFAGSVINTKEDKGDWNINKKNHSLLKSKIEILKSYFYEELRISVAAQVFVVPIIFFYFRQISLVSPLANILVAWTIAPVMILGLITVFFGMINWQLGFLFASIPFVLLKIIVWVVDILSLIPYGTVKL